jgi:RNA polymerase sigma-70 factor, ECF subfamily
VSPEYGTVRRQLKGVAVTGSDVDIWRALCGGDASALTAIYERHADAVYNFAFRRTASWSTAEDAVQATFTTLWRRAREGALTPLRLPSARPLLLTMAGHECANLRRSQRRRAALLGRLRPGPDTADHAPQVAERLDDERRMSEVRRAMRRLSPAQQEASSSSCGPSCRSPRRPVSSVSPKGRSSHACLEGGSACPRCSGSMSRRRGPSHD